MRSAIPFCLGAALATIICFQADADRGDEPEVIATLLMKKDKSSFVETSAKLTALAPAPVGSNDESAQTLEEIVEDFVGEFAGEFPAENQRQRNQWNAELARRYPTTRHALVLAHIRIGELEKELAGDQPDPAVLEAAIAERDRLYAAEPLPINFNRARLADVVSFLFAEADVSYALPEGMEEHNRLVSFQAEMSPFESLDIVAKHNGYSLAKDGEMWTLEPIHRVTGPQLVESYEKHVGRKATEGEWNSLVDEHYPPPQGRESLLDG